MKELTLIAKLPLANNSHFLRKLWVITSYLKEEVGIRPNLVIVKSEDGKPQLIVMDEVISLYRSVEEIIEIVASKLSYDVSDRAFLDKVAGAATYK